jgi:hypothetical protein
MVAHQTQEQKNILDNQIATIKAAQDASKAAQGSARAAQASSVAAQKDSTRAARMTKQVMQILGPVADEAPSSRQSRTPDTESTAWDELIDSGQEASGDDDPFWDVPERQGDGTLLEDYDDDEGALREKFWKRLRPRHTIK